VNLQIETDDGKQVPLNVPLSFENGICSSKSKTNDDGNEVEVEVTWYPEVNFIYIEEICKHCTEHRRHLYLLSLIFFDE
jgi:hypothetical protein